MQTTVTELVSKLARRDEPRTEATLQADLRQLLLCLDLNLGDQDLKDVTLEAPVGDGRRIDIELGATVIEVKKDLRIGNVRREAVGQLEGYVAARERTMAQRYVGVLTDGAEWRCYHLVRGSLVEVSMHDVTAKSDADALSTWLEGVLATTRDVNPRAEVVRLRLGVGSSAHQLDRATLRALYDQHRDHPGIRTKRRLWARLLKSALGTQFEDDDRLFVEHSLLVSSAEIIAHAALGLPVETIPPASLLSGAKFDERGVHGVVEADFFDWVVDAPGGDAFVRALARRLARFDWSAVEHDVLKVLYESVIGSETRKKLGEYYTPDWLAEKIVEDVVTDPLAMRVLDPACGSGTFLFHAVRKHIVAAEAQGMPLPELLDSVTDRVIGIDLHPVAVTLARVTYLLALGRERLTHESRGSIRVPVYLGDSMQWQRAKPSLLSKQELRIVADDGAEIVESDFRFPLALLANARGFDELVSTLADKASSRTKGSNLPSLKGLLDHIGVPPDARGTVQATFETMCRLHDEGRDHIWGYYIRNLARPEWLAQKDNRADVLIGNPPWLSYRFMPADMQKLFREMCDARRLWTGAKVATHQDLSALFVARAVELYLRDEGSFAFVVPNAVLDRAQFKGFRTGSFDEAGNGGQTRVRFGMPWDLRKLRPHFFPRGASVVFGKRSGTNSPMPRAEVWSGRLPATGTTWAKVEPGVTRELPGTRTPDSPRSHYALRFKQGASIVPRVLFMVERQDPGPLGRMASTAVVRSSRTANEKRPWKDVPDLLGVVETEFIRPVHLGESVLPYRILAPREALIPWDMKRLVGGDDERLDHYPALAKWWRAAEDVWTQLRSSDRLTLLEQLDYHQKLSSQFPIQPQRVVYTKSGMHLAAARLSHHRAVIDHTLYWATAFNEAEALFLCAVLNAATTTRLVRPLMSYGKDERHIDKFVWKLPIPPFDAANRQHAKLAELGAEAELLVGQLALDECKHFAASRRAVREALAGSDVGKAIEKAVKKLLS